MAYTPINWQTGDTITAEKMNKMDNGWGVETSGGTLFSETVTTEDEEGIAWGEFSYSTKITAETVTVTFNGTDYQCQKVDAEGDNAYGGWGAEGPDFTSIPFAILSGDGFNEICTPTGGTYTVKVDASTTTVETSANFSMACNNCVDTSMMPMLCVSGVTLQGDVYNASSKGRLLYFKPYGNVDISTRIITDIHNDTVHFTPTDPNVTATFSNGVFTVMISG